MTGGAVTFMNVVTVVAILSGIHYGKLCKTAFRDVNLRSLTDANLVQMPLHYYVAMIVDFLILPGNVRIVFY